MADQIRRAKTIGLSAPMWKLLQYAQVCADYEAMKAGQSNIGSARLVEGIVRMYLMEKADDIQTGYYNCLLAVEAGGLPAFHTYEYLVAIAISSGTDVPELVRLGRKRATERRAREEAAARAVRCARGRPSGALLRANGRPFPVRGGSGNAGSTDSERAEAIRELVFLGEDDLGPGDAGLGEDQAPEVDHIPYLVKAARSRKE